MTPGPRDLDRARAQADVIRAIAESGEPRAVLDLIVARLPPLLGARRCFVVLVDRHQRAQIGAAAGLASSGTDFTPRHDGDGIGHTAMTERRAVTSPDVLSDHRFALSPLSRRFVEREGYRSALAIPLRADTRVLGVLIAGWAEVGAVAPAHVEIAQPFAGLAVLALERARLSSQATDHSRLDEALADIERQLLGELSLDRLLPSIIEHARRLVDAEGSIYLAEPGRKWLRQGWTSWPRPLGRLAFGEGIVGECARDVRGLIVNDYPRWPNAHAAAAALGMRHVMAQPLSSLGRLLGVIVMGRREHQPGFEPADLELLDRFATHAALALGNATIYAEAEQRRRGAEALARTARALSETAEPAALGARIVEHVAGLFTLPCTVRIIRPDGVLTALAFSDDAQAVDAELVARAIADGIAVDKAGNAYVVGTTDGSNALSVTVGPDLSMNGGPEAFVAKIKADGSGFAYLGYIGGMGEDHGEAIAIDAYGNAYVTGYTSSAEDTFPVKTGPKLTRSNYIDAFVAKVNSTGSGLVYCGYIGGSGEDHGTAIDVDTAGNAYVAGWTNSNGYAFTVHTGPATENAGGYDGFVAKIKADGSGFVYAGFIGGAGDDVVNGIAVDAAGIAHITGTTTSDETTFPVKAGPGLTYGGGAHDAFVAGVAADGSGLVYAGYVGGAGDDSGNAIALDASGNVYIAGATTSDEGTFPVIAGFRPQRVYRRLHRDLGCELPRRRQARSDLQRRLPRRVRGEDLRAAGPSRDVRRRDDHLDAAR